MPGLGVLGLGVLGLGVLGLGAQPKKCNFFVNKGDAGDTMSWADKFNLFDEFNILRITCAVFFIPHIIGKITVPATLEFFVKAGFKPPATWMYIAGAIETVLTIGLFFGIYTPYVGFIAFIHLLVAAAATYRVTECWIWVIGGVEYCIFWAICCLVVAMHAYHAGI